MKRVESGGKIPIKMWLDDLEEGAFNQAWNLSNLPFAFKHIAIMPDSHQGYGMPIGAVLATKGVIIPNAVGVDIGCGMCAIKTDLTDVSTHDLQAIIGKAYKAIPVGFNSHKNAQDEIHMPRIESYWNYRIMEDYRDVARKQLGTLGGGNHFIEIQKGNDGFIWIMIHSGSRKLGYTVAKHYNKVAEDLNEQYASVVTKDQGLAFLPLGSDEANNYIREMKYCVDYAFSNRKLMMDRMIETMIDVVGPFKTDPMINESHNFAAIENHFGSNVMVHRKGATRATEGELGMIPSSQGTKSYIVRGKGNAESFRSCSHGAGRAMGRKQAIRELDYETELAKMDGIVHGMRSEKQLDEAPSSYKDINTVMANQIDLVEIVVELTPLAVIKG